MTVFNFDISGSHKTFHSNPWYLFGNLYNTGLPDDVFGAVIALGGPLTRVGCLRHECITALRELARLVKPRGRLLIEYSMPTTAILRALQLSELNYEDYFTYKSDENLRREHSPRTSLLEILLGKEQTVYNP